MTDDRESFSWDEFGEAARTVSIEVWKSGFTPDVVVAIARGGLLLAGAVAYALDVKSCGALNVEFYTGVDARLDEPLVLAPHLDQDSLSNKKVLVVDDVSDSGHTLAMVMRMLANTGADVRSLCLYSKPGTILVPDFVWRTTEKWINFPWSVKPPVTA